MDLMNVELQTLPIKASFLQTTIRFDLPSRSFQCLQQELSKRLNGFDLINYIDDEGDTVRMSTDEELEHAISLSKGVLKLVLVAPSKTIAGKHENRIRKWLKREEPEKFAEWEQKLLTLSEMGFYRCRHNLQILKAQEGNLQKTIEVLRTRQGQQEERLKRRELKKLERGLKRKYSGDGHGKRRGVAKRCKKERPELSAADQSSDQASQDFLALANQAFIQLPDGSLPGNFKSLFVDGNNMLYLTNRLRAFTLQRKVNISQKILASVTRLFSTLYHFNTELVFDSLNSASGFSAEPEHLENGSSLCISSAHPEYPTSDAKFLAWARANPELAPFALVVTSDRALAGELHTLGVSVVKPGVWLAYLAKAASGADANPEKSMDWKEWFDAWIERRLGDE